MLPLLLFYMIFDRRELTNTFLCVKKYILRIILRFGCFAMGKAYPFFCISSCFFLLFCSLVSVLLLATSLIHVVPWPTTSQSFQLAFAPGNFSG